MAPKRTKGPKRPARKPVRGKVSKSPQRSKTTGRFATDAQRARDSIRQLQRQAREEKEAQKRFKAPPPKYVDGKTGRYMSAPKGNQSPADKALGKLTKGQVTRRTEERLGILDNGRLPPYDAKKVVTGIDRVSRTYLYYWRYEGLLGEDMARGTLRALIRYSEHDAGIIARVVIRSGYGKNESAVNSRNGYPQQVLAWLDDLLARESVDEILGISEGAELRFEVIAITHIQMEGKAHGIKGNTTNSRNPRKVSKSRKGLKAGKPRRSRNPRTNRQLKKGPRKPGKPRKGGNQRSRKGGTASKGLASRRKRQ